MVRICEIPGGDPSWEDDRVTWSSFCQERPLDGVINSQMIIDVDVNGTRGSKNLITISRPVMERLLDGKTRGLAIKPLGAVNAIFYAREDKRQEAGPVLHFTVDPKATGVETNR